MSEVRTNSRKAVEVQVTSHRSSSDFYKKITRCKQTNVAIHKHTRACAVSRSSVVATKRHSRAAIVIRVRISDRCGSRLSERVTSLSWRLDCGLLSAIRRGSRTDRWLAWASWLLAKFASHPLFERIEGKYKTPDFMFTEWLFLNYMSLTSLQMTAMCYERP